MRLTHLPLFILALGSSLLTASASEVLVDTIFGANRETIKDRDNASGELNAEVKEDSSWANLQVDYSVETDVLSGTFQWIRAEVSELKGGRAQLKWAIPSPDEKSQYRISANLASTTGSRMRLFVADQGAPYTIHWETSFIPSTNRTTRNFDFALPPIDTPIGLILAMEQEGEYDLGSLSMERRTDEDLRLAREAAITAAPKNLAPNAGFALGLPIAWSVNERFSIKDKIAFKAAETKGPHGTTPLVIDVIDGTPYDLYSAPFDVPDPSSIYVTSFIATGEGSGEVTLLSNGQPYGSTSYTATPEGTLVKFPFKVDELARWNVIHWHGKADMQIDALNVSLGRQALPFQLPGELEVALAADMAQGNVFVEGVEAPTLQYAVTGLEEEGLTLRTKTYSLYGQSTAGESMALCSDTASGQFTPTIPDMDRPYGSYRVEAWVECADERISPVAEVVYHVVPRPHYWGEIAPESRFGHHLNLFEPHLYAVKAVGMNWARFHAYPGDITTYWSAVEPEKGKWTWHDDNINRYREAGFATMGVLVHTPPWARPERADPKYNGWLDNWWQPRDYAEFGEYVYRAVKHHADNIDAWMIWNEPWGEFWFKEWRPELGSVKQWYPGDTPLQDFAELSQVGWEAYQKTGVEKPFLSINGTLGERGKKWMRDSIEAGIHHYGNGITYHAYFGGDLAYAINENNALMQNLQRRVFDPIESDPRAAEMPIWMTEGNWLMQDWSTGMHYNSIPGTKDPLEVVREKSIKLPLYLAANLAYGADKIFTYAINAGPQYFKELGPGEPNWGAITNQAGELHPSATALAAATYRFEKAEFKQRIQVSDSVAAFVFENEDGSSLMAVFGANGLESELAAFQAAGLEVADFLGNPAKDDILHHLLYVNLDTPDQATKLLGIAP